MPEPTYDELKNAVDFLQSVRQEPSLLQYFDETILSLHDLSAWAQSIGYDLSDESLARALQLELRFRWAAVGHPALIPS